MCQALIGKTIDNFRLIEAIGQGGMGCVYRAIDEKMDRTVALKIILHKFGVFSAREGKALGQLNHPNIVNVFYMGECDEGVFIAMEYIEGRTLTFYKNASTAEAVTLLKQSLLAIEHAHEKRVYHRDIKPSNIMVNSRGVVKVMDFGLAKVNTGDLSRTITQIQAGTINYMSPEQVRGLHNVDHRSDIYSLGKTFYEIFAGRLPYDTSDSDQFDIWKMIVEVKFKPPSYYNRAVPRDIDRIIMKALEKDPAERYQNAREMLVDVEAYERKKKNVRGGLPTNGHRPPEPTRRRGLILGISAIALLLVLAAGLYASGIFSTDSPNVPPTPPAATSLIVASDPPDAELLLDGVLIGQTPTDTIEVDRSQVHIRLSKVDYEMLDTTISVAAGRLNRLNLTLRQRSREVEPTDAFLTIESTPGNANVYVDRVLLGATPVQGARLSPGRRRLEITLQGYQRYVGDLDLTAGDNPPIRVTLNELGGITVSSNQPGATVFVDGEVAGPTPLTNYRLAAGNYRIEVSAEGFTSYTQTVQVSPGTIETIDAPLEALMSTLRVLVNPFGSIFIDGENVRGEESGWHEESLPRGRHVVRATHSGFGEWEKEIVLQNQGEELRINFQDTKKATITSGDVEGAAIFVNGDPTDITTPGEIELRVGRRRIEVRKEGYTTAYIDVLVESSMPERVEYDIELNN